MSDDLWLGLTDAHGVVYVVNARGAWKILATSEIDNDIIIQLENVSTGEPLSIMAAKIEDD